MSPALPKIDVLEQDTANDLAVVIPVSDLTVLSKTGQSEVERRTGWLLYDRPPDTPSGSLSASSRYDIW